MNKTAKITFFMFFTLAIFIAILAYFQSNLKLSNFILGYDKTVPGTEKVEYLEIPDITVNITGRADRYCKAGFTLAVYKNVAQQLDNNDYILVIQSNILRLLASYSYDALSTFEGKQHLKNHIRESLNKQLSSVAVDDVYIRHFIFQ